MFQKTYFKLAGLYLAVLMLISLFFSVSVYQLSLSEFDRGFRGPIQVIQNPSGGAFMGSVSVPTIERLQDERLERLKEARTRILSTLILVNIFLLVGGGFLSYYLARWTLRPIEEAHEAQNRFTADASHELRTPIAAMRSEIEVALLDKKLSTSEARLLLNSNLEELDKLTALSEGLLKLAVTEKQDLQKERVAVDVLVDNALTRVLATAEKRKILVVSDIQKELFVDVESTSMTESLVVLLDNAIKYSSEKSQVDVKAKSDGKNVLITVKDTGVGIKASELPHVFDRFYRADTARSKHKVQGYGLGLSIAKNIVDLHDGAISVRSKPSKGSSFTISLALS